MKPLTISLKANEAPTDFVIKALLFSLALLFVILAFLSGQNLVDWLLVSRYLPVFVLGAAVAAIKFSTETDVTATFRFSILVPLTVDRAGVLQVRDPLLI